MAAAAAGIEGYIAYHTAAVEPQLPGDKPGPELDRVELRHERELAAAPLLEQESVLGVAGQGVVGQGVVAGQGVVVGQGAVVGQGVVGQTLVVRTAAVAVAEVLGEGS